MGFSQTSLKIASWSWTLLVDLACQCHVGGVLPNLSSACGTEPSRLACLVYLLLIFGSSSWVSRRAWTVVWNLAVYGFWVGAVEVLHAVSSLFRVKDERDSAPRCIFCRCQSLFPSHLAECVLRGGWEMVPWPADLELAGSALLESRGCFQGRRPSENKGNLILQHTGCQQAFGLNAASSVVFLLPAKWLKLLNALSTHSFFPPSPGKSSWK